MSNTQTDEQALQFLVSKEPSETYSSMWNVKNFFKQGNDVHVWIFQNGDGRLITIFYDEYVESLDRQQSENPGWGYKEGIYATPYKMGKFPLCANHHGNKVGFEIDLEESDGALEYEEERIPVVFKCSVIEGSSPTRFANVDIVDTALHDIFRKKDVDIGMSNGIHCMFFPIEEYKKDKFKCINLVRKLLLDAGAKETYKAAEYPPFEV